jgi:pseudouridine-5'-phosphate glycosidase
MAIEDFLKVDREVADTLAAGGPVVALETTFMAHGLPHPRGIETARAMAAIIRDAGAVPAAIGILDGRIRVGLSDAGLETLARGDDVHKVSRRDLPYCLARGEAGATTVAATMICARMAGIAIFATGGIGGVHRGWQETFDVSADLEELARTDVAVVCAGAKSILDLPATLEYLETRGVPVVGYGTDTFPAFHARSSGIDLAFRLDTPAAVARLLRAKWGCGLSGGVVIANPLTDDSAMDDAVLERHVKAATGEAIARGIHGKDLTPFLLDHIATASDGRSLDANIALLHANAGLAARIAKAYADKG